MKRHLNTSYRLVWNHITGTLVVASELARLRITVKEIGE
ncbi:hypothetical protein THOESC015_40330 [Escherichia coli]|nr:ESPR-type extended signal peptide-containing protein [Escherichia coli]BBW83248.1 hypothetical protein THOESC015_40330 [Escherichia coli]